MENNNKLKLNKYRIKSLLLQKKLLKNISTRVYETDVIKNMEKCIESLKDIDSIFTLADIEEYKYNSTQYPDSLTWYEINARHSFFAIILGYLDSNINKLDSPDVISSLIPLRELVVEDYKKTSTIADPKLFRNIINSNPSYNSFYDYFNDYSFLYNTGFNDIISSYLIGYNNYYQHNIYDVICIYKELYLDLINYKSMNKDSYAKVKKL